MSDQVKNNGFIKCPRCGVSGIHACPGEPIQTWTADDHEAFENAIAAVKHRRQECVLELDRKIKIGEKRDQ